MTTELLRILDPVKTRKFKYGQWDCYQLAKYLRVKLGTSGTRDLPNFDFIYHYYNKPGTLTTVILEIISCLCKPVIELQDLDLVVLSNSSNESCLGTFYQGNVIYMFDVVMNVPIVELTGSIQGVFRY